MSEQDFVTVAALAQEWGLDRSNARKYIMSLGLSFLKVRAPGGRGQKMIALTLEDAECARQAREDDGFVGSTVVVTESNGGYFYIAQLVPDLDKRRVKLGFASNVDARLQAHRTAAPTAELVKAWPCKKVWEQAVIDSITRMESQSLSGEVFVCDSVSDLTERADEFFALMPGCC